MQKNKNKENKMQKNKNNRYLTMNREEIETEFELILETTIFDFNTLSVMRMLELTKQKLMNDVIEKNIAVDNNQKTLLIAKRLQQCINQMEIDFINECIKIYPDNDNEEE